MQKDEHQKIIHNITSKTENSELILEEDVLELLQICSKQSKEIQKLQKQNNFFTKQWDKKILKYHEQDEEKDKLLQQQSKMAAMGEMMDAVAHQWKQPLNSMGMMSDMLKSDFEQGLVNKEYIDDMTQTADTQIEHMISTLNEFRTFFRPVTDEESNFYLKDCISSVQVLMKDELIINNIITYIKLEDNLIIHGKENEFKHLFLNLLTNSIDAFNEKKKSASRHIYIKAYRENEKIYIEFEDNAGGIDESIIDDIFKPNITTKENGKGTGIGLYMSYQIIEKNNAEINVHNSIMGAFFTITLH